MSGRKSRFQARVTFTACVCAFIACGGLATAAGAQVTGQAKSTTLTTTGSYQYNQTMSLKYTQLYKKSRPSDPLSKLHVPAGCEYTHTLTLKGRKPPSPAVLADRVRAIRAAIDTASKGSGHTVLSFTGTSSKLPKAFSGGRTHLNSFTLRLKDPHSDCRTSRDQRRRALGLGVKRWAHHHAAQIAALTAAALTVATFEGIAYVCCVAVLTNPSYHAAVGCFATFAYTTTYGIITDPTYSPEFKLLSACLVSVGVGSAVGTYLRAATNALSAAAAAARGTATVAGTVEGPMAEMTSLLSEGATDPATLTTTLGDVRLLRMDSGDTLPVRQLEGPLVAVDHFAPFIGSDAKQTHKRVNNALADTFKTIARLAPAAR